MMKKIFIMVAILLIVGQMPVTAMAHGANNKHSCETNEMVRGLCNTAGCNVAEDHQHGSKYYYGHTLNDGHDYHEVCSVEDCTLSSVHQHDDEYYFEHSLEDGHDYHTACNVKGCTEITKHEHESKTIKNNRRGHHNSNHNRGGHYR